MDYYLNQTRRGLADYYLPDERADDGDEAARLSAPGSSWWGSGSQMLDLSGAVGRAEFVPLYAKGVRPGGGYLGRRFRLPKEAAAAKADALRAASEIVDPYERWMAKHEIRHRGGHASVAAWDCTFSPPKNSLLWAAGDQRTSSRCGPRISLPWRPALATWRSGPPTCGRDAAVCSGVRILDTTGFGGRTDERVDVPRRRHASAHPLPRPQPRPDTG